MLKKIKKLKAKNLIPIGIGLFLILFSSFILLFDNPFKNNGENKSVLEATTEVSENTASENEMEEENTEETVRKVYATEYGDKSTTDKEKKTVASILNETFNVSYRTVQTNPEAFKKSVLGNFEYLFFNLERNEEGIVVEDPTMPFDFADKLIEIFADNNTEMKVEFTPEYEFKDSEDLMTYLNGKLTVTFYSGTDLEYLSKIFGIKNAELNKTYEVDYSIGYVNNDNGDAEILVMVPHYLTVAEIN